MILYVLLGAVVDSSYLRVSMLNWMISWSEREGQGDTFQADTMFAAWRLPKVMSRASLLKML